MVKNIINIFLFIVILQANVPAAFKDFGWGARAAGMGGAFSAVADDASAPFYNPAGIGRVPGLETMFMHSMPYFGMTGVDVALNMASIIVPVQGNVVGVNWSNLTSAEQYSENIFALTYSRLVNEKLFAGINLKYLGHSYTIEAGFDDPVFDLSETGVYGYDVDVGFLFCMTNMFCIGGMFKNMLGTDMGLYDSDELQKEVRGGAALHVTENLTLAMDVDYRGTRAEFFAGVETWFSDRKFGARAGTNYRDQSVHEITAGASYRQLFGSSSFVTLDYSFSLPLTVSGTFTTHRFAVSLGL